MPIILLNEPQQLDFAGQWVHQRKQLEKVLSFFEQLDRLVDFLDANGKPHATLSVTPAQFPLLQARARRMRCMAGETTTYRGHPVAIA